jgi:hypothetical protein
MVPLTFFHELSPSVVGEIDSALPTWGAWVVMNKE